MGAWPEHGRNRALWYHLYNNHTGSFTSEWLPDTDPEAEKDLPNLLAIAHDYLNGIGAGGHDPWKYQTTLWRSHK